MVQTATQKREVKTPLHLSGMFFTVQIFQLAFNGKDDYSGVGDR